MSIPKKIHYCWFGHNPKPKLAEKCIKSWKRHCPDYEIIEWNEDNFDVSQAPLFVQQAYTAKKWAFVSDYVRLYAIVQNGGIYMDTDAELIKPLDSFLQHRAFSGFENDTMIPTCILACEKGFPLFDEFLHYYDDVSFLNQDGSITYVTNVEIITNICLKYGLLQNNQKQTIQGFTLYPKDVFCPIDYMTGKLKKTKNTTTIHWFSGSWQTKEMKERHRKNKKQTNRTNTIHAITHVPHRLLRALLGHAAYESLKRKLK